MNRKKLTSWFSRNTNNIRISLIIVFLLLAIWAITLESNNLVIGYSGLAFWLTTALINVAPELAGIVIGVVTIDYLNKRRQEQQLKAQLIRQMASPHNDVADPALRELTHRGWVTDGSLQGANLTKANLTKARLVGADLIGADLTEAILTEAVLTGAKLTKAFLTESSLSRAKLIRTTMTEASLTRADVTEADLKGADLTGAYLINTVLTVVNLTDVNLTGAYLTRANLTGANLTGADLTGADLYKVILKEAKFNNETKWPADFDPVSAGAILISEEN